MELKNNITNVINLLDYETEVKKSYKWEKPWRTTFPVDLWIPIFIDYLYKGKTTTEIEKEYTKISQNLTRDSNNMYICTLLGKFYFPKSNKIDVKKINQFPKKQIENWIIEHINDVTKKHYKNSVPKAKKVINEWKKYIFQTKNINYRINKQMLKNIKKSLAIIKKEILSIEKKITKKLKL